MPRQIAAAALWDICFSAVRSRLFQIRLPRRRSIPQLIRKAWENTVFPFPAETKIAVYHHVSDTGLGGTVQPDAP